MIGYAPIKAGLNSDVKVTVDSAKVTPRMTAMIHIAPEKFRRIPTYTVEQYPAFFTPAYRTQTYQYYGLTPGQARRAARILP